MYVCMYVCIYIYIYIYIYVMSDRAIVVLGDCISYMKCASGGKGGASGKKL